MDSMTASEKSNNTSASAHHQQDEIGTMEEARSVNQARQQQAASGDRVQKPRPQLGEALKCPRCDSSNTKFCYYNNYNMLQPRYFCKACRRYWTQGGTLRNVPVGGGRRKNKRSSSSATASGSSSDTITRVINNNLHALSASASFSNVLPTFMSTGLKFSLPLAPPLSLSSGLAPSLELAPGGSTMTTPSFMDILRGGFLNHQGNGSFYGPTPSGGDGMEMSLPPSFGLSVTQPGIVGDHHGKAFIDGGRATATTEWGGHHQWAGMHQGHNNDNVSAEGSDGLEKVGADQQQEGVVTDRDNENGSSTSRDSHGAMVGARQA
ncbi:hypothetical protein EJB05_26089 [Eragrostis curvula]|uniref:Dof zinc finger protein n=1 Tax=Eragrostis curvula TaxID=38414 RepID=A0A5J9UKL6_9POAL|nr:hypothetical protein EJB05_26089 [Eragrostis curvula]